MTTSDPEIEHASEVAIIGAGLAGTTLALACRQSGLRARLYDAADHPGSCPDLIELGANGSRVLHALGLRTALAEASVVPMFATVRSCRTAFMLSQRPLGAFSEARYGAPTYLIEAGALTALLWQAARHQGVPLETGGRVMEIQTETATLTLANGETRKHLAAAVATGVPGDPESPGLSEVIEPRAWQRPTETTLIRARGLRAEPDREHGRFINTWLGSGLAIVERPHRETADGRQPVELTAVVTAPPPSRPAAEALEGLLSGAHPHLAKMLESAEAQYLDAPTAPIAENWHAGRTVLLGSASHGGARYPDLSASAALEDAWVLSRMMERWEEEPHQDFAEYERFRKPRARRLRAFAAAELDEHTLRDPMAIWRRNLKWSLTSRFLPEVAMQKLDWLYGYDCIKGFA